MGRADKRRHRVSPWVLAGPVASTAVVVLDTVHGSIPLAAGVPLVVVLAAAMARLVYLWWVGRHAPPAPRRASTSRWSGGRPDERWR